MSKAFIAYSHKKGLIKSVSIELSGEIDELGVQLNDYFKDLSDVKELVKSSIDYIDEGEVTYLDDIDDLCVELHEFEEFDSKEDFINEMEGGVYYYLFENDTWFVSKPNQNEFKELETVLEEEF